MKYYWYLLKTYLKVGSKNPPAVGSQFLTGYGRVNTWASSGKKLLRKDLIRCKMSNVKIYTIELAGWAGSSVFTDPKLMSKIEDYYVFALKICRVLGLWLHVSIVNDNMGSGKYGDTSPTLDKGWSAAVKLLEMVKKHGPKNVLAQPVGEAQSSAGYQFEKLGVSTLQGFKTVNNNNSRPSNAAGMNYFAWHPSKVTDIERAPVAALIVSDTGAIIREISEGLEGPGKPDQLVRYKNVCKGRGCPAAIYYAFKYGKHDRKAIEAMRT